MPSDHAYKKEVKSKEDGSTLTDASDVDNRGALFQARDPINIMSLLNECAPRLPRSRAMANLPLALEVEALKDEKEEAKKLIEEGSDVEVNLPIQQVIEALKGKQQEAIEFIKQGYNELIIEIDQGLVPLLRERIAEIRSEPSQRGSNLGPSEATLQKIELFLAEIKNMSIVNSDDIGLAYQFARHVKTSIQALDEALTLGQMNSNLGTVSQWQTKTGYQFLHHHDFFKNNEGQFDSDRANKKLCDSTGQTLMSQHLVTQRTEAVDTLTENNKRLCNLYLKLDRYDKDILGTNIFSMTREVIGDVQNAVYKNAKEFRGKAGVFKKSKEAWGYQTHFVTQKPTVKETMRSFFADSRDGARIAFDSLTQKAKNLPSKTLGVIQELPKQVEIVSSALIHCKNVGSKKVRKIGVDKISAPSGLETEELKVKSIVRSMYWLMQQPALRMQYDFNPLQAAATNLKKEKPLEADFAAEAMQDLAHAVIDDLSTGKANGKEHTSSDGKNNKASKIKEFNQACSKALEISEDIREQMTRLPILLEELVNSHSASLLEWGKTQLKTELKNITDSKFYDPLREKLAGIPSKLTGNTFTEDELGDIIHKTRIASLSGMNSMDDLDLKVTSLTGKRLDPFSRRAKVAKDWGMKANETMPNDEIPTIESLLQSLNVLEGFKSEDDPEGILFATRMWQEWHYARKEKTILPKSPQQHLAEEKSFAEFAVNWGQKQAVHGRIYAVIEAGVDLASGATVTLVKGIMKAGVKTTIASFKILYMKHQVKNGVMPGEDYPYKVMRVLVNNRLKRLGFKVAMSFVPGVIKTGTGIAVVMTAYAHNAMVDPKNKIKTGSWLKTLAVTATVVPASIVANVIEAKALSALNLYLTSKQIPEQKQKLRQADQNYTNGIKTQFEERKQQFRNEMKDNLSKEAINEIIANEGRAFSTDLAELQAKFRQKLSDSFDMNMQDLKSKKLIDSWNPLFAEEEEVENTGIEGRTDSSESVESEAEQYDVSKAVSPISAEETPLDPYPGLVSDWQYKVSENYTIEITGTKEYFEHVSTVFNQLSETTEGKRLLEALQGKDFSISFPNPELYNDMIIYPATTDLDKNVISFDPLSALSFNSDSAGMQQPQLILVHELIHILDKDNLIKDGSTYTEEDKERLENMAVGIPYIQDDQTHDFSKTEVKKAHLKEGAPIFTVNQFRKELGLSPRTEYSKGVDIDDGKLHYKYYDHDTVAEKIRYYRNHFRIKKFYIDQQNVALDAWHAAWAMPYMVRTSTGPTKRNVKRIRAIEKARTEKIRVERQLQAHCAKEETFITNKSYRERLAYAKIYVAKLRSIRTGVRTPSGMNGVSTSEVLIAEQYLKQVEDDIDIHRYPDLDPTDAGENLIQNVSDFKKETLAELELAYASGEFVEVYALILSKLDSVDLSLASGYVLTLEETQALEELKLLLGQAERELFNQAFYSHIPDVRDLFFNTSPEEVLRLMKEISGTISNDPSFEGYRWPLLPSELIYIEKNGSRADLVDTILLYRQGRWDQGNNIEQVEAEFYASTRDIVLSNGEIYTAEQQMNEVKAHGGLFQYEKKIMNKYLMTNFMYRVSPDGAATTFWRKRGITRPRDVKFTHTRPDHIPKEVRHHIKSANIITLGQLQALLGQRIELHTGVKHPVPGNCTKYDYVIRIRDIEQVLGWQRLYSVDYDGQRAVNCNSNVYAKLLEQRANQSIGAITALDNRENTQNLLQRAMNPPLFTDQATDIPHFIKPYVYGYPLENMLVIKDGVRYTMISVMPDGQVHHFESKQALCDFFRDGSNRQYILSHVSLYNQTDGHTFSGVATVLNGLATPGNSFNNNKYVLSDEEKGRVSTNNIYHNLAVAAIGSQNRQRHTEIDLVSGLKNNYEKYKAGNEVKTENGYELPEEYKDDSFNKIYKLHSDADLQPMIIDEIDNFKRKHLEVFTQYLENQYKIKIEKAESDGVLSSQEANALRNIPDNAYVPSLSNGKRHYPLEGMLLTQQGGAIILVSLQSNGGVHKFNSEYEFNLFFANPANKDYILSHMSEFHKQPGLLSTEDPARSLQILAAWSNKFYNTDFPAQYRGVVILSEHNRAHVSHPQNIIGQSHVRLNQNDVFETMAGRMLDRLKSDADTLITSDSEWKTDKFFEISGYILGAASIFLTGGYTAGIGGAYALGTTVVVDIISAVHGVAEGLYLITQGDTARERNFGLLPLVLAPLDLLGAGSGAKQLKALKPLTPDSAPVLAGLKVMSPSKSPSEFYQKGIHNTLLKRLRIRMQLPPPKLTQAMPEIVSAPTWYAPKNIHDPKVSAQGIIFKDPAVPERLIKFYKKPDSKDIAENNMNAFNKMYDEQATLITMDGADGHTYYAVNMPKIKGTSLADMTNLEYVIPAIELIQRRDIVAELVGKLSDKGIVVTDLNLGSILYDSTTGKFNLIDFDSSTMKDTVTNSDYKKMYSELHSPLTTDFVFNARKMLKDDPRGLEIMNNAAAALADRRAYLSSLDEYGGGEFSRLMGSRSTVQPQDFFLEQPHSGELAAFCGYYALSNYLGRNIDLSKFRKKAYQEYRDLGISEDQIPLYVLDSGAPTERIAIEEYGFIALTDPTEAIASGRFMAATNKGGGHWLTYIRDSNGDWWEYDSWRKVSRIGDEPKLRKTLTAYSTSNVFHKAPELKGGHRGAFSVPWPYSKKPERKVMRKFTDTSGAQSSVVREKVGNDFMLYKQDGGVAADTLLISVHGGYHSSPSILNMSRKTGSFMVPDGVTINFLGPHGRTLVDPGLDIINTPNFNPYSTVTSSGHTFPPYISGNSGRLHMHQTGMLEALGTTELGHIRDYRISKYQGKASNYKEVEADVSMAIQKNRALPNKTPTDILTVRERTFALSDLSLSDALNKLDLKNSQYKYVIFSGCRHDNSIRDPLGYSAKSLQITVDVTGDVPRIVAVKPVVGLLEEPVVETSQEGTPL
ncbi:MAG: hypothetical protein COA47_05785 [Robiginitomaculum sp.]|nr:MAG: hypothetical protein COA47_05785 [Robiginitomaculum sp.]